MTANRNEKRAARERSARTGESYQGALMAMRAGKPEPIRMAGPITPPPGDVLCLPADRDPAVKTALDRVFAANEGLVRRARGKIDTGQSAELETAALHVRVMQALFGRAKPTEIRAEVEKRLTADEEET